MKLFIAILPLLVFSAPAKCTAQIEELPLCIQTFSVTPRVTLVASIGANGSTSKIVTTGTFTTTVAAGGTINLNIIMFSGYSNPPTTITDLVGINSNTYTLLPSAYTSGGPVVACYYCINPTYVGNSTVTCSRITDIFPSVNVLCFNIISTGISVESSNGGISSSSATVTTIQPGSGMTPSVSGELLVSNYSSKVDQTVSVNSGFTMGTQVLFVGGTAEGAGCAWLSTTSTGTINPTFTISSGTFDLYYACGIWGFKY